jgi:hypothetical protein
MVIPGRMIDFSGPSALFHLYQERGRRQFWAQARSEGGSIRRGGRDRRATRPTGPRRFNRAPDISETVHY